MVALRRRRLLRRRSSFFSSILPLSSASLEDVILMVMSSPRDARLLRLLLLLLPFVVMVNLWIRLFSSKAAATSHAAPLLCYCLSAATAVQLWLVCCALCFADHEIVALFVLCIAILNCWFARAILTCVFLCLLCIA